MALKYNYKPYPLNRPDPITKQSVVWRPSIPVVILANHKKTVPIESLLDTGADSTIFHAQLARPLGIDVTRGIPFDLGGIAAGVKMAGYIHRVRLVVAGEAIDTSIVFAENFAAAGLLGQVGFFEHFIATFDWTPHPPCFELQRIQRN